MSEHGDQPCIADTVCEQAACGAAPPCEALPAGDAELVVSPQQPSAQGLGSGHGSLYAQPRAWDDQWEAGGDGAVTCGVQAPSLASGSGSEHGVVDGLEARLRVDREHASSPAMHAALAQSGSAGSSSDVAAQCLAGDTENVSQLSEAASNAGAGACAMDTADQQHEPGDSAATCSCGLAYACKGKETVPPATVNLDAAGVTEAPALAFCISTACMLDVLACM